MVWDSGYFNTLSGIFFLIHLWEKYLSSPIYWLFLVVPVCANKNYYYINKPNMNMSTKYQPNATYIKLWINKNFFGDKKVT